ncbi:rubrerythrin family protein [Clostridium botulinum C]|uniref:Rubrerythrin family protein n=4 Tax=Clostridium TaxID=1485 RepID=A0A9Q4TIV5_CLOBO|nr:MULTISPECIES: rubrerythrin family protein [Clostridium]AYF53803.1 rubrerythrin family protein [Clostridium novyi]EES90719.1 rubrerythrin [Clostridium botulinum D str. 1873]KEI08857.1 rubrerythrin [Clostridium sp. K25]KEI17443.1 rubrerythrin [Clostridium haemolyticum NCTC 9693]KGN04294.1 rubrerythrin [Clostridium haemolyticum NCTC 8350]
MKNLNGTKTAENLMKAFAGESQATMKYSYYASKAKKEGYIQISNIFTETAGNEKEHAKIFLKYILEDPSLPDNSIKINAEYSVALGDTKSNLNSAANGEEEEWDQLYPYFAKIADEEGFNDIASSFRMIAEIEDHHKKRFKKLLSNIESTNVFKKETPVFWKCLNCGYIHEGIEAPEKCPACAHPQGYFEVLSENY